MAKVTKKQVQKLIDEYQAHRDEAQAKVDVARAAMENYEAELARIEMARNRGGQQVKHAPVVFLDLQNDPHYQRLELDLKVAELPLSDWDRRLGLLRKAMRALEMEGGE